MQIPGLALVTLQEDLLATYATVLESALATEDRPLRTRLLDLALRTHALARRVGIEPETLDAMALVIFDTGPEPLPDRPAETSLPSRDGG